MKDQHDKDTRDIFKRRGRSPKFASGSMTPAERKAAERARRKAAGQVLTWLTADERLLIDNYRKHLECEDWIEKWKKLHACSD